MVDRQNIDPYDMNRKANRQYLNRLHRSRPLMTQLSRLGYAMETPVDLLQSWQETAPDALRKNHFISEVMADLRQTIPGFRGGPCDHCPWRCTT